MSLFALSQPQKLPGRVATWALACITSMAALAAHGSEPPAKPANYPGTARVSLVVPYAPGGTTDIVARLVAEGLRTRWGATVVVEYASGDPILTGRWSA